MIFVVDVISAVDVISVDIIFLSDLSVNCSKRLTVLINEAA